MTSRQQQIIRIARALDGVHAALAELAQVVAQEYGETVPRPVAEPSRRGPRIGIAGGGQILRVVAGGDEQA